MTKKKNGFFTFICSLIPGAGEMYLGFMKEGVSIMSLAFILFGFAACINIEPVLFLIPIIWFYSFRLMGYIQNTKPYFAALCEYRMEAWCVVRTK